MTTFFEGRPAWRTRLRRSTWTALTPCTFSFLEVVRPLVAASSDGTINAKDLLKQLAATMLRGRAAMAVAAMCLTSSGKVAEDNLTPGTVVDMFLTSFNECKGSDGRVSVVAAISSKSFKAWSAATGFRDAASNDHTEAAR